MSGREQAADVLAALARTDLARRGVATADAYFHPRANRFAVLTYHRVSWPDDDPSLHPGLVSATPDEFARQIRRLAAHRPIVGLDQLLAASDGAPLPAGALAITFDDGYRDVARHAWPLLRDMGLPATLFIPTGFPGRSEAFWWDRLAQVEAASHPGGGDLMTPLGPLPSSDRAARHALMMRLQAWLKTQPHAEVMAIVAGLARAADLPPAKSAVLDWSELRHLASEGLTIAPHSVSHPLLNRVPPDSLERELARSLSDLRQELGAAPLAMAYPSGAISPEVVAAARAAGFKLAFTTRRGGNVLGSVDWMRIKRINVGRRASATLLQAQLLAWTGGHGGRTGQVTAQLP